MSTQQEDPDSFSDQQVDGSATWDVFLSYAREDEVAFAHPLQLALLSLGIAVWYDQERLLLGMSLKDRIKQGIDASRFGIALLTPNYFRATKRESTLFELDEFLAREANERAGFLLPVLCDYVDLDQVDLKYRDLKHRFFADWAKGPKAVLEKILRSVKPGLLNAEPLTIPLPIPTPDSQGDAMRLAGTYERMGQYKEAAEVCLRFLQTHPNDANTLKRYLGLTQQTHDRYEIGVATVFALDWLKTHPDDAGVRDKFLRFIRDVNRKAIPGVTADFFDWLSVSEAKNPNLRAAFLSLVMEFGPTNNVDVITALELGRRWLEQEDVGFVRAAWFLLATRQGGSSVTSRAFDETAEWLEATPEPNVLAVYLKEVARLDVRFHYERAFDLAETWFDQYPHDTFVMPVYLDLAEVVSMRVDDPRILWRAISRITNWMDDAQPSHQKDTRIREKYISTIRRVGDETQKRDAKERTRTWLIQWCGRRQPNERSQRPLLKKATNVWVAYLGLIADAGTKEQVLCEIEDVLDWLHVNQRHGMNLRAQFLRLVEERIGSASVCVDHYRCWLRDHATMPQSIEVRYRFIHFVASFGNRVEMQAVKHDTEMWLQGQRRDIKVYKALQRLSHRLEQLYVSVAIAPGGAKNE